MPDCEPITETIPAPPSFRHEEWGPNSQFPPIQKMPDGRLIVDWWTSKDGMIMCKIWTRADHPNMATLPEDAPRAVRTVYTADIQLAMLRGTNEQALAAMDAWERYSLGGVPFYDVLKNNQ